MLAFENAMIARLANNLMDAVETVTEEDPGLHINVVPSTKLTEKGEGVIEVISVGTQNRPEAEGFVQLKIGMPSSTIADLIREKLKPSG